MKNLNGMKCLYCCMWWLGKEEIDKIPILTKDEYINHVVEKHFINRDVALKQWNENSVQKVELSV
jgi:hypothetical protein